ncbi:hypothetical protein AAMO2058_001569600 [Amorphochlora amoebiformis]
MALGFHVIRYGMLRSKCPSSIYIDIRTTLRVFCRVLMIYGIPGMATNSFQAPGGKEKNSETNVEALVPYPS